ncbi:hypothetical protein TNCV_5112601 [Trichonephila clavipes]|nr:hypothetical protein TNCV_5112601 [Trichonephila clavipes]
MAASSSSFIPTPLAHADNQGDGSNESGIVVITPQFEEKDDRAHAPIEGAVLGFRQIKPDACVIAWMHVKRHRSLHRCLRTTTVNATTHFV